MLGGFDNYNMGYEERDFAVAPEYEKQIHPGGGIVRPSITVDGRFVGTWRSKRSGRKLAVTLEPFEPLEPEWEEAIAAEVDDIGRFEGLEARIVRDERLRPCARRSARPRASPALSRPAAARAADQCLIAEPPAATAPPEPLRFGITPQLAGTVGSAQGAVEPEDPAARAAALAALRPPRPRPRHPPQPACSCPMATSGIATFAARARRYARKGFLVEAQVRYHPAPEQEGDIAAWRRFVRRAVKALAANDRWSRSRSPTRSTCRSRRTPPTAPTTARSTRS